MFWLVTFWPLVTEKNFCRDCERPKEDSCKRPTFLRMNPGGRNSEGMPPPSNSETAATTPTSDQSSTTLQNGSSLSKSEASAKTDRKVAPPAVQIRLISQEGEEKSIQTQVSWKQHAKCIKLLLRPG